jgi:hypothetical protein
MFKKEVLEWATRFGNIPKSMINFDNPSSMLEELSESNQKKLVYYVDKYYGTPLVLTGKDSFQKDRFAVCLLLKFASDNRKIVFYSHPNQADYESAWATAIMRLDLATKLYIPTLATRLVEIMASGYVFIVGSKTLITAKSITGLDFLASDCIEIEITDDFQRAIKI